MLVKELIEVLQKMDPDRVVILQKDAEGNGYSPLCGIDDNCAYRAETTYSGEVLMEKLSEEDKKKGYTEEDVAQGADWEKAVVIFPIN